MAAKGKILVIDDSPDSLRIMTDILKNDGYEVYSAINGSLALRAAAKNPPDLVLLDIRMPDMDGYDVIRHLKAEPKTRDIPVIFVSAEDDDKPRGFKLGAVDFVMKPYEHAELLARVHTHLELARTRNNLASVLDAQTKIQTQLLEQYQYVVGLNEQLELSSKQLKLAQNQLLQAQKMSAIGVLAAGVAHEINNPLAYVNSNLGTLKDYMTGILALVEQYEALEAGLAEDNPQLIAVREFKKLLDLDFIRSDAHFLLSESRQGLERVKKIVRDLKDFSRSGGEDLWGEADIHKILNSVLNIVWNELKYKCDVIKAYGTLPAITCVASQLNQVIINLLVNAAHAIETHGTVTIRTGCEPGRIWFEIADTGKGIPPENIPLLFDPFFTTKPVGQGTGLGLSVSYSIIEKHHGKIEVKSEVGKGSVFRVWLPVKQGVC